MIFVTNEPNNLLIPPGGNYPGSDNCYTCNGERYQIQEIMKERQESKSLLNTVVSVPNSIYGNGNCSVNYKNFIYLTESQIEQIITGGGYLAISII